MPYVSDAVAHVLWYNDHIATVHFENGKYHVHKESVEAAKKTNPDQDNDLLKKNTPAQEHLMSSVTPVFSVYPLFSNLYSSYRCTINSVQLIADFPPPRI